MSNRVYTPSLMPSRYPPLLDMHGSCSIDPVTRREAHGVSAPPSLWEASLLPTNLSITLLIVTSLSLRPPEGCRTYRTTERHSSDPLFPDHIECLDLTFLAMCVHPSRHAPGSSGDRSADSTNSCRRDCGVPIQAAQSRLQAAAALLQPC